MPTTTKPKLARTTFGKGSAAKQDAIQKAKVAESKQKLDDLIARQEGRDPEPSAAPAEPAAAPAAAAKKAPAKKAAAKKAAPAKAATTPKTPKAPRPALQYFIDDKAVAAAHNRLAGVSRATGRNKGTRISTADLRALLQKNGIADPDGTAWKFTLPNGVVLEVRPAAA